MWFLFKYILVIREDTKNVVSIFCLEGDLLMLTPVIMCGGTGDRLWPISRKSFPKQFVPLVNNKSLLQATMERAKLLAKDGKVWTIASQEHRFFVQEAAALAKTNCLSFLEPVARNTAAATAIAALNASPDTVLLFLPADHYVPDNELFVSTVLSVVSEAQKGKLVIFGISPSSPHCGYGYVQIEEGQATAHKVKRFVEKPELNQAVEYIASGDCYWNSGMFLCTAKTLVEGLQQFAPDILDRVRKSVELQRPDGNFIHLDGAILETCRSQSIDYALLEHHQNIVMAKFKGAWSDVGSWSEINQFSSEDKNGNNIVGQGHAYASRSTLVYAPNRPVITMGVNNLIVVDDKDAVLVVSDTHLEQVKDIVQDLKNKKIKQAEQHRYCVRPWGSYDVLEEGPDFKVKRIMVKPGGKLSLQMHEHRAEHWIVVKGTARVAIADKVFDLHQNQSTYIPNKTKHRLSNLQDDALEIIEIQSGTYLEEDDIIRFEDAYGRSQTES